MQDREVLASTVDVAVLLHCSRDSQGVWHATGLQSIISPDTPFANVQALGEDPAEQAQSLAGEYSWRMAGLEAQLGEGWIKTGEQRAALVQRMKEDDLTENEKAAVKLVEWRNSMRQRIQDATSE